LPTCFYIGTYDTPARSISVVEEQRLKSFVALNEKYKGIKDVGAER
jgi:hypothetical protein